MKMDILLGLQWGDEGKGKIVDVLTPKYDVIARFQGGPNAGHSLEFNGIRHVLHIIPSGIFHKEKTNIIGNGVVIDPIIFEEEINALIAMGLTPTDNLFISRKAHLILPTHKLLDAAQEAHNAAVQDLRDAERDMETALKSGSKKQIEAAQAVLDAANDAVNVTSDEQTDAEDKSEAAKKKLADNTEKAANGIQNFANYVNEMANGSLYGFANGISKLVTSLAKGSDGVGKSLGELGGKIGGIIGAILQIIDALGDDPAQFINDLLDKVAKVVEKILSDLPNLIANIVEGVGNIVGGVVSGVGKLFGFDMSGIFGGGTENFDAAVERWGYLLDTWKENLEYEKSLMKEAYGSKVTEIQNKTVDYLRQSQQAAAATYRAWASDGAGWFSHSNGYEANRDAKWSYLWQYDQELAKQMGASEQEFLNQFKYIANGDIGRLFDLSVEQNCL